MPQATAGVQSTIDVESSPVVQNNAGMSPGTWSWIWFILAILLVLGFHLRVFGHPVPPSPHFP